MIDPERLLGGMLKQGLRSGRRKKRGGLGLDSLLGSSWKAAAGIGALGVAIAAFEHFTQKPQAPTAPPAGPGPITGSTGAAPPPVPPAPPPAVPPASPAVDPAVQNRAGGGRIPESDALLLIRAMIAAANADGEIDSAERSAILSRLEDGGISDEERALVNRELDAPSSIDSILPKVRSTELAAQIYAVSLLAIEVDTKAERDYLAYLRMRLDLSPDTVSEMHRQFGLQDPAS